MKRLTLLLLIISSLSLNAQTILKGKSLSERLQEIEVLINQKRFEQAIELFNSKTEIISIEKIKKDEIEKYNYIKTFLTNKEKEFKKSENDLIKWSDLFTNKDFEVLLSIFPINLRSDGFKNSSYPKYNELNQFVITWKEQYNTCYEKCNNQQLKSLLRNKTNSYKQAIEYLEQLKKELVILENIEKPIGNIPNLEECISTTKQSIIKRIKEVESYIEENKPLTQNEIKSLFQNNNLTIAQIKKYANFIEKRNSEIFIYINYKEKQLKLKLWEFADLLELDVVRYHKLWDTYDSELKVKAFSNTDEYKKLYSEMKQLYDYVVNAYFYMPINFNCYSNKYSLKDKSFEFWTSELNGSQFGNKTNYIQFENLCVYKPNNISLSEEVIFGGTNYLFQQSYKVPVINENIALIIEEQCRNTSLLFILKIKDVEAKQTALFKESFVKSNVTHLLIFNNSSDEIYVRYQY